MIRKVWIGAKLPPLLFVSLQASCQNTFFGLPVDEVAYQAATAKSRGHRKRERSTGQSEADTSNEHHGLQAFAKDGDEW